MGMTTHHELIQKLQQENSNVKWTISKPPWHENRIINCLIKLYVYDNKSRIHIADRSGMFAGIQEILLLVVIILAIFFLPRILSKQEKSESAGSLIARNLSVLSGRMRLAIVFSLIWPLSVAGYFEPWEKDIFLFLIIGIGPVICGWSLRWVLAGFRKNRPKS